MTETSEVRLMLVDDQDLVRAGVRRVLESQPGFVVTAETGDADAVAGLLLENPVDVLVLDLNMPGRDGFEVLRDIRAAGLPVRVLVLSLHDEPAYVARAVRDGANGYLLKDTAVQELPAAIRAVMAGGGFYSPRAQQALGEAMRAGTETREKPLERLTTREIEVLRRVSAGQPSKAIAADLAISIRTVETHRANLMRKLNIHSVSELVRYAIREKIAAP